MSTITLIDPRTAGISGDMLLGAFIDAGAELRKIQEVLDLIPQHYPNCKALQLQVREVKTHGFRASAVDLRISEDRGEIRAEEFLHAAETIARASRISDEAAHFAVNSIKEIVTVESRLHGATVDKTHLHEAGAVDTLADVFGVAAACDALGVFGGKIYSTPVAVGGGTVTFSHGTLATPAPAVLEIAKQRKVMIVGGPENVELATPTGISMLANLAHSFVETFPPMVPEITGYGAGKAQLNAAPNMLRVIIGRSLEGDIGKDTVQLLETNLDDLPGEVLGHTLQRLMESGAKDVWISSAQFKKNRPGHVLHAICDSSSIDRIAEIMMEETGTLGVRYQQWNRFKLQREIKTYSVVIAGRNFDVRVKLAKREPNKIMNLKPEFDDIHSIAKELSMPARRVSEIVRQRIQEMLEKEGG